MPVTSLLNVVLKSLSDMKGIDVLDIDVSKKTEIADYMVIVSGTSTRHVKAMATNVSVDAKAAGFTPLSIEGHDEGEWVLVDLNSVIVHLMIPKMREFYDLERLWNVSTEKLEESRNIEH